jgi:hypothetical protein
MKDDECRRSIKKGIWMSKMEYSVLKKKNEGEVWMVLPGKLYNTRLHHPKPRSTPQQQRSVKRLTARLRSGETVSGIASTSSFLNRSHKICNHLREPLVSK